MLVHTAYGKSRVRLVQVARHGDRHDLRDLTVAIQFEGDYDESYTAGDNSGVLPTDTMKNTVYALAARGPIDGPEPFALELCRHFLDRNARLERVRVDITEQPWGRIATGAREHGQAFVRQGSETRSATVTQDRQSTVVEAGLADLVILKSSRSAFSGYLRDEYTTLPETRDRILATSLSATWRYRDGEIAFAAGLVGGPRHAARDVRGARQRIGAAHDARDGAGRHGRLREKSSRIHLVMPNRHHLPVDLTPFGLENRNEIFVADRGAVRADRGDAGTVTKRAVTSSLLASGRSRDPCPATWSSEASGSRSLTGCGRPRSTSATDASWPSATTPSAPRECASWTPAISSSCRASSTRTCTSTIPAAPTGRASSTRRRPPRRAASRRSWTCRSTAFRRRRTSKAWRQSGAPRRGSVMSTSGSGEASCPATALRSSRSPAPECSASSAFCRRRAWRSSPTSPNRTFARRCRSSPGSDCRCSRTPSGRRFFAIRSRRPARATRRGSTAGRPRASSPPSSCSCGWPREYGARVHIVHLASADALTAIREARAAGLAISVETCPHYLSFAAEEIPDGATAFKCAPPIRERDHRERLWKALSDGDIDLIATDHSPAPPALKRLDAGDFVGAWGGIASLQLGLAAVWTGASARGVSIETLARWLSRAPARLAGLDGVKGAVQVGCDADLVIWDPDATATVDGAPSLPSSCRHAISRSPAARRGTDDDPARRGGVRRGGVPAGGARETDSADGMT